LLRAIFLVFQINHMLSYFLFNYAECQWWIDRSAWVRPDYCRSLPVSVFHPYIFLHGKPMFHFIHVQKNCQFVNYSLRSYWQRVVARTLCLLSRRWLSFHTVRRTEPSTIFSCSSSVRPIRRGRKLWNSTNPTLPNFIRFRYVVSLYFSINQSIRNF